MHPVKKLRMRYPKLHDKGASKSAEDAEIVTEKAYLLGQQINEITTKAGVMSDIATKAGEMNTSGQGQMQELKLSFNDWETNLQAMCRSDRYT